MNGLTLFIRRPVLSTMLTTLLLVLGFFSYRSLGVDLTPKVEVPVVTVMTVLRGASPEEIETLVTKPIEEAVNTVSAIDELSSYSFEGVSRVVIRFLLEKPIAEAVQDVRDRVSSAMVYLPRDVDPPVVSKVDFDAFPVLTLAVSGKRDMKEISEIARLKVKESIENVNGVGAVNPIGSWKRAVNVILDVDRLEAQGISIAQVKAALAAQNVEIPSGRIDRGESEQVLRTLARVEKVEDFKDLVVTSRQGRQITLGDLARVEDSVQEPRGLARLWKKGESDKGISAVSLDVVKQSGSNTVQVIRNVKERLEAIKPLLPTGIEVTVLADQSIFINRSIHELQLHLVLGGLLASLAVLLFMGSLRSTIIAAVAIPTSLIATFTLMRSLNFTLNNMSLLGLTLAVGIVIDDAIVVLENIFRHMEEYGKTPYQAAMDGLKEIGLAVMATTTSLMVIFLPVAFMQGMVGRFFYEFGLTVAFAIGVSLLIALTLTPMLSSRFLKPKAGGRSSKENRVWQAVEGGYGWLIDWSVHHRLVMAVVAVALVLTTVPIAKRLGKDFMPIDDRSEFVVTMIIPAGSTLSSSSKFFAKVEERIRKVRGVTLTLTQIGSANSEDVTTGKIYVAIQDLETRDFSQFEVMKEVRALMADFPELRSSVNSTSGMGGGRAVDFQYNLTGPELDKLVEFSDHVARELRKRPGFVDVDTSLASRQPEVRVRIDRKKAADLGVTAADVASTLKTMVGGEIVTKFREGVEQYDVWLRLDRKDRSDAEIVSRLPLNSPRAGLIPLSQVASLSESRGPSEIDRYNRQRLVSIYANLDKLDLGRANLEVGDIVSKMHLPVNYSSLSIGRSKMMAEAMTNMLMAFMLAFIFMYIVLAAQFESFLHPVTILLSLPLTLPFALVSLLIMGDSLNLYSLLGVFMLFGIVKKNGILQIDYTNTLRAQGRPLGEAIREANLARLRPILMTTLTLIAGMTPIALGKGPGAASRASLAKVIIGGQALSLFITLLIVPVAYSAFESLKGRMGFQERTPAPAPVEPAVPTGEIAPQPD